MHSNIYQPSGKSSALIYVIAFFFLLIGVPLLSSVYSLLLWYIPFIYVHFLFTAGLGIVLALTLNKILKIGKVRSKKLANCLALIAALLALYFVWTSYITLLFNAGETITSNLTRHKLRGGLSITKTFFNIEDFINISLNPRVVSETMSYLYAVGAWSIFKITVKGFVLGLIWFLEAIVIVGFTFLLGTSQAEEPFSEESNEWFDKKILPYFIKQPENLEEFVEDLKNGKASVLSSLEYDSQSSMDYYQITTFAHSNEPVAYINFSNVKVSFDDKGKESQDVQDLAKNVKVSLSDLRRLEEQFA
ncbi:hypothetical protein P1X15_25155 [Runella sp. MFBS21]|uniref:hypothetical protein n=1 Tax=Runella sp. MFBS21 TaxID=3034018 RepID=UPI0023F86944|nr:hypothetical protein [Runella sp. MFBS21]MDF7820936.1 hypothetical protein [Runella sp. MFBS21]